MKFGLLGPVLLTLALASAEAGASSRLVVFAPGYPSNTEEAQPLMDELALAVAGAGGWSGDFSAVYHPTLEGGLAGLDSDSTAWAIVSLPVYLKYRERFSLEPIFRVVQTSGEGQVWSLVARKGALEDPAGLAGWQVKGLPAHDPRFVRKIVLADWGSLPESVEIRFESRVVSALRGAARGEKLAVLLDASQADALERLPFSDDLEIVTRSAPLTDTLFCRVGRSIAGPDSDALHRGLIEFGETEDEAALLQTLRIRRFESLDLEALRRIERLYGGTEP